MLNVVGSLSLALARSFKTGGIIINEHVLDHAQTRRHVETLGRWFDFIHLDELPQRIHRRGRKPFCLLTFDDGKRSNATVVAPELLRLGAPAAFFVVTNSLGTSTPFWFDRFWALHAKLGTVPRHLRLHVLKQLPYEVLTARIQQACLQHGVEADLGNDDVYPMSWQEARALRRHGFSIGAHGHTHAILTRETRSAAFQNIATSIAMVTEKIGSPCPAFAFPNGNYTPELALHAIRCGARFVLTTEPTWVDDTFPLWRLPRIQLSSGHDPGKIQLKIALAAGSSLLSNPDGTGREYRLMNKRSDRAAQQPQSAHLSPTTEAEKPLHGKQSISTNGFSA